MGDTPKIRFKGFADDWEWRKLSDFTWASGKRNKEDLNLEPYAITNEHGFIPQNKAHDEFGYMKNTDRKAYNIVTPNSFAYNPARINVGSIGYYEGTENVIVSSLYEVFQTADYVDNKFLWHWFKSDEFSKWIERLQEGSVRLYFYYDKLCECQILMPSVAEQKKIATSLDHLDYLITLHHRKCDEIKELKKYMLQKMFPQNGKKIPEIRFAGFTDAWEQRKLGEITDILSASRVHKEEWKTEGVPFFRSSDVMAAFKGTKNDKVFISQELFEKLSATSGKPQQGDIFITGGGSIGTPYIVPNNEPLYSKDADLIWVKKSKKHDPFYLYSYFISPIFREYLLSISQTGTIAHYTIEQVKKTPVFFPSLEEQQKIGVYFSDLDHLITLHQHKCDTLKEVKKFMLQNMFPQKG